MPVLIDFSQFHEIRPFRGYIIRKGRAILQRILPTIAGNILLKNPKVSVLRFQNSKADNSTLKGKIFERFLLVLKLLAKCIDGKVILL